MKKNETQETATAAPVALCDETKLYKTNKALDEAMAKAAKSANAVQSEYQLIACSAIVHIGKHKDVRVIRKLLDSMPEGMRKQSMSAFIDKYAAVRYDDAGQVHYDGRKSTKLGEALVNAWWKAAGAEQAYKPFVLAEELKRLVDRAEKRMEKGNTDDQIDAAELNVLKRMLNSSATKGNSKQHTAKTLQKVAA